MSVWRGGQPAQMRDAEWEHLEASFLGCGYRVSVPSTEAVDFARGQADAVASLFGVAVDRVAWDVVAAATPCQVIGGWVRGIDRSFGEPFTRITALPLAPAESAVGVRLPWLFGSDSPTAGLAAISRLDDEQAERWLAERGSGEVGLWFNRAGHLCTTTAGPLLVESGGVWCRPAASTGLVPHWAFDQECRLVGAEERLIAQTELEAATRLVVIAPDGTRIPI